MWHFKILFLLDPVLVVSHNIILKKTTDGQMHHFTTGSSSGRNKIKMGYEEAKLLSEPKESNYSKQAK